MRIVDKALNKPWGTKKRPEKIKASKSHVEIEKKPDAQNHDKNEHEKRPVTPPVPPPPTTASKSAPETPAQPSTEESNEARSQLVAKGVEGSQKHEQAKEDSTNNIPAKPKDDPKVLAPLAQNNEVKQHSTLSEKVIIEERGDETKKEDELPKLPDERENTEKAESNTPTGDGGKVLVPDKPTTLISELEIKPALKSEPPEIELIKKHFTSSKKGDEGAEPMTASDILQKLSIETMSGLKSNSENIGKALKFLGFEKVSKRTGKTSKYVYWVKII